MQEQRIVGLAGLLARVEERGRTLCGWTLRTPLQARGSVCASWLAERPDRAHLQAVVRILREPFAGDPEARSEWLRASWAANRFEHARVAKILEEGVDEAGAPFVVRRWIGGEDLEQAATHGRIDLGLALRIAEQLLDALEMAHAHGIAHGAIAPSNVIVTPRGSVRLVDFATIPGLHARRTMTLSSMTAARVATFAAPERRFGSATEQADIWSVAACLHFSLSGAAPIDGALPPLRIARSEIDPNVAAVVDLALAPDPADRYESAYAMLGDVRRVMAGRAPKLGGAHAAVPSQGVPEMTAPPASTGGASTGPTSAAPASAGPTSVGDRTAERPREPGRGMTDGPIGPTPANAEANETDASTEEQWRGNVLLVVAIAVLVGVASFVMFREKLADVPETHQVR